MGCVGYAICDIINAMEPIRIRIFDKPLDVRLTGNSISLPQELKAKIESYWQGLLEKNPKLRNGEVFTVNSVKEDVEAIRIRLDETNYAHYLYSRQIGDLGEYTVRIIHPAALVISSDNRMIFGSMGLQTAIPHIIQCCGGGIDRRAVGLDGVIAIDDTMNSELMEELGFMLDDKRIISMAPSYLKFGGPTGKMTLVYVVKLNITSEQYKQDYMTFIQSLKLKGEDPEFAEIFCIDKDATKVDTFINQHKDRLNEYMAILLRTASAEEVGEDTSILR
jgi:hypothetical protein